MAGLSLHRSPSAGSIIKKMIEINPDLGVHELGALIRQATALRGGSNNDYSDVEVIDEEKALRLARESLRSTG
jgi:hypothetical protein